jgi:uncharacterized damage-inducible protein DinB
MTRSLLIALAGTLAACALHAQSNPMIAEVKQSYTARKNHLMRSAEKMPDDAYSFKPTPEMRSFGQLVAHIADAQMRTCAAVKGEQKQADAASKTTKTDLVAALKASFDECDSAFETINEASANEMIKMGNNQRSKLGALFFVTVHDNEEYGYLSVYLRLKGVTPPSSEPR